MSSEPIDEFQGISTVKSKENTEDMRIGTYEYHEYKKTYFETIVKIEK